MSHSLEFSTDPTCGNFHIECGGHFFKFRAGSFGVYQGHMEWLKNPTVDWSNPGKILANAPKASAVTDCKSVYDLATKTSTPSCSEYRTTLECLLIRERLQENIAMRWISTQAMLADTLTKTMDSSVLRQCLKTGQYSLFDETESLKKRASKRERLRWIT